MNKFNLDPFLEQFIKNLKKTINYDGIVILYFLDLFF